MRLLNLVRTAILIFVNVSACYGIASHTRRVERMNTTDASKAAATTNLNPTRAETIDKVHGGDKASFNGKNDEARGPKLVDYLSRLAVHVIDSNLKRAETIEKLSNELKEKQSLDIVRDIFDMVKHDLWQLMEKEAHGWLQDHINPKTVFLYLELGNVVHQSTDLITLKYEHKLILWFHYITQYRLIDSMDSNYAAFKNKELLEFLVEQSKLQNNLKVTLSLRDKILFNPYVPVVSLFDSYRNDPGMNKFAAEMLAYMVTDPMTKDLVLDEWLRKKISPKTIFVVLHLGDGNALIDTDDVTLFTVWLQYVKKYLNSGALNFDIGWFIEKELRTMSTPRAKVMFESNALENVLGDVEYHTGNLAAHVRDIWQRFPQIMFVYYKLLGETITSDNSIEFVKFISSAALHAESKPFNGDLMFDLLIQKHSFNEVVWLFQKLERTADSIKNLTPSQRPVVKEYARSMVQYLFDSSSMLKLPERDEKPDFLLDSLISDNARVSDYKDWFKGAVAYFRRVEKSRFKDAIMRAIFWLEMYLRDSGVSWLKIVEELQNEDARVKSAYESMYHNAGAQA